MKMVSSLTFFLPSNHNLLINIEMITEALCIDKYKYCKSFSNKNLIKLFEFKSTKILRLDFMQIGSIGNLTNMTSLTRLYLDNNAIKSISGIDHLIHLKWLDLSSNCIKKIEGLDNLTKLEVLVLFENKIKKIENLDHLRSLSVLRLGRNQISNKEEVFYLRKIPSIKTLDIHGNPFCKNVDWKIFIKALLPSLKYLEPYTIDYKQRDNDLIKYQGDIFRAQNKEEKDKQNIDQQKRKLVEDKRKRDAFVSEINGKILLEKLLNRNFQKPNNMRKGSKFLKTYLKRKKINIWEKYYMDVMDVGDQIFHLGHKILNEREKEILFFHKSISKSKILLQELSIKQVEYFLQEKEKIVEAALTCSYKYNSKDYEEVNELQREEIEKIKDLFSVKVKHLYDILMNLEIIIVNQIEKIIAEFENEIQLILQKFLNKTKFLYSNARSIDIYFFKNLSQIAEKEEEAFFTDNVAFELHNIFIDDITNAIAQCHDEHQLILFEEENRLNSVIQMWEKNLAEFISFSESFRNRKRIVELNHFNDTMRREEEDIELLFCNIELGENFLCS